jgi:hypothetical protein
VLRRNTSLHFKVKSKHIKEVICFQCEMQKKWKCVSVESVEQMKVKDNKMSVISGCCENTKQNRRSNNPY